jgi:hypothetical protein
MTRRRQTSLILVYNLHTGHWERFVQGHIKQPGRGAGIPTLGRVALGPVFHVPHFQMGKLRFTPRKKLWSLRGWATGQAVTPIWFCPGLSRHPADRVLSTDDDICPGD